MNLQLLRGRDLRPPSRHERTSTAAVSKNPIQEENISTTPIEAPLRKKALRFPVNPETRAFYRRFYPDTTTAEWNDWRWQMRTRIRTLAELDRVFTLSKDERDAVAGHSGSLPVGITPYYTSLMGLDDPTEPLRRTHIMVGDEYVRLPGEEDDPVEGLRPLPAHHLLRDRADPLSRPFRRRR